MDVSQRGHKAGDCSRSSCRSGAGRTVHRRILPVSCIVRSDRCRDHTGRRFISSAYFKLPSAENVMFSLIQSVIFRVYILGHLLQKFDVFAIQTAIDHGIIDYMPFSTKL